MNKYIDIVRTATWTSNLNPTLFPSHIEIHVLGVGAPVPDKAHRLNQVHGAKIIDLDTDRGLEQRRNTQKGKTIVLPTGDGIFTTKLNTPLAIRTADCLPILLFAKKRPLVMGIHAGWKGFVADILGEGLKILKKAELEPDDCGVFIGPAIGLSAFEVGSEVIEAFKNILQPDELLMTISKGINDRWHLDLQLAACLYLSRLGINPNSISIYRQCTKSNPLLHSYRREGAACGHNFSIIKIRDQS